MNREAEDAGSAKTSITLGVPCRAVGGCGLSAAKQRGVRGVQPVRWLPGGYVLYLLWLLAQ